MRAEFVWLQYQNQSVFGSTSDVWSAALPGRIPGFDERWLEPTRVDQLDLTQYVISIIQEQ